LLDNNLEIKDKNRADIDKLKIEIKEKEAKIDKLKLEIKEKEAPKREGNKSKLY
jgi:hypothetical protein